MGRERQDLGAALSLLARRKPSVWLDRIVPGACVVLWMFLTAWSFHLIAHLSLDGSPRGGRELQLGVLAAFGLLTTAAVALLTLRIRRRAKHVELTARGLRKIIETSQDVIWVIDAAGNNVFLNEATRRVYGYEPEELIGRSSEVLLTEEHRERDAETMARTASGESVYNYETEAIRKDGGRIPILCNASALRDAQGKVVGSMGSASDISKLKGMQRQLLQNERQQALGTLASGVVHDFNNLLTVILGQTERARDDEGVPDKAIRRLEAIGETAERASRLVARLLVFTDSATANRTRIDLAGAVLRMESFLADLLGDRGSLTISTLDAPIDVSADWGQIEQIVMNLVLNARDAIDESGRVQIRVRRDTLSESRAAEAGMQPGAWACLEVCDDGTGMDAPTRERIFEPFFTTKGGGQGTGLGLAGVQGIVRQHEGAIQVESSPGEGTTMTVHLPLVSETVPVEA